MRRVFSKEEEQERRRTIKALLISLLVHLILILLVAFILSYHLQPAPPEDKEQPLEITMVAPPPKKERDYIDTSSSQAQEKAPENAPFESDKNTEAASEKAASGEAPAPSMEGANKPNLEMQDQEHTVGKEARQSSPPAPPPNRLRSRQIAPSLRLSQPHHLPNRRPPREKLPSSL